jgi:flagellar biosynthesis/type III secretory pathway M-ring protein FliF/YscJ
MAKAKKEVTPEDAMAKNEKHNDGSMSGLKKTMIGTVGTLVTAGGAFLMTYMQKPKEGENKQVQPQSININIPQQQQAAGKTVIINKGGGTTPAGKPAEAPKPKKKEGDEFKEKPAQW